MSLGLTCSDALLGAMPTDSKDVPAKEKKVPHSLIPSKQTNSSKEKLWLKGKRTVLKGREETKFFLINS